MRKLKLIAGMAIIISAVFLTAGCTEGDPPPEPLPGFPEAEDFEDILWSLESYGEPGSLKNVLAETEITATFNHQDSRVQGNAGANSYSGGYQLDGDKLTIPLLAATEMFRLDPEGVMDQEYAYLKALTAAESYQVRNGKLEISGGGQILIFNRGAPKEKQSSTEEPDATVSITNQEIEEESVSEPPTGQTNNGEASPQVVNGPELSNALSGNCMGEANEDLEGAGLPVGDLAVDFTLNDVNGNSVNLAGLLGEKPVVMIFGSFT